MAVDYRLGILPADYGATFIQSFQAGRDAAKQHALEAAYATHASDPAAGTQAAMAIDPAKGMALQQYDQGQADRSNTQAAAGALASGDDKGALAAAGQLDPQMVAGIRKIITDRDQAKLDKLQQTLEATAHVYLGLQHFSTDPAERLRAAQHIAQTNPALGIDPTKITLDDVTDRGLQMHAMGTKAYQDFITQETALDKPFAAAPGSGIFTPRQFMQPGGQGAAPDAPMPTAGGEVPAAGTPVQAAPQDVDALARMIYAEAGGEGPQGMAAAGHVAVNRLRTGYGGAKSLTDVVGAPHQFEGMTSSRAHVAPTDPGYQAALQVAQGIVSGQIADPTNGAVNFLNPELQGDMGRQQPAWATGGGLRIGRHVFYGGQNGGGNASTTGAAQPYEVASNGPAPGHSGGGPVPLATVPAKPAAQNAPSGYRFTADGKALEPIPGGPADSGGGAGNGLSGKDFLGSLDPARARLVQAIADGRADPRAVTSLRGGERQRLIEDVAQYDPTFDLTNYGSRAATRKDFSSGKAAANVTAINTAVGHLNALDRAVDRLNNVGFRPGQKFANFVKNQSGQPEVVEFEATKEALASELTRVFTGAGGSVFDREGWQAKIDAANSPEQLHGVVRSVVDLLNSRINALGDQYKAGMGREADPLTLLKPQAAFALTRLQGGGEAAATEAAARAGFYTRWREKGGPSDGADAAWEAYRARKFGGGGSPTPGNALPPPPGQRPSLDAIFGSS